MITREFTVTAGNETLTIPIGSGEGNNELPEGLVEEVALLFYDNSALKIESCEKMVKLALSVIAPYYEKQIAELKAQNEALDMLHVASLRNNQLYGQNHQRSK
jgi:hypothetical protein